MSCTAHKELKFLFTSYQRNMHTACATTNLLVVQVVRHLQDDLLEFSEHLLRKF